MNRFHLVFLIFLLSLAGFGACRPAEDPEAARLIHEAQRETAMREAAVREASAGAGLTGAATISSAMGVAERFYGTIPVPKWSHFPGMKGERVRRPLRFEPPEEPGPVLFIMMDTTRADSLSAYGYERPTSPNLEKIAQEGVRMSRFYSNGAWTRPSVASMMTSRYRSQHNTEVTPGRLKDKMLTAAEIYKSAGYATAGFVGNQTLRSKYNFQQGFDRYDDIFEELSLDPPGAHLVQRAIRWLDGNKNPRWFMWVFLVDPHDPYNPERSYDKWERGYKKWSGLPSIELHEPVSKAYVRRIKALYDAEICEMDDAIGKLVGHLKASGQWENLTVVVAADHGEAFGENKCFLHPYHFWEPNINIPVVFKSPSIPARDLVEDRLFQGVDILPTLLDMSGVKRPKGWKPSGLSIAQLWSKPITEGWNRSVFTELDAYGLKRDMVRRGDYKYLRFRPTYAGAIKHYWPSLHKRLLTAYHFDTRQYLFNVSDDPKETRNLIEEEPAIARAMANELDAFKTSLSDEVTDTQEEIEGLSEEELEDLRNLGYIE